MSSLASLLRLAFLVLVGTLSASGGDRPATAGKETSHSATSADTVPEGLAASDWSSIRAVYDAGRHKIFAV